MGQKINPHGLRIGVTKDWESKWYAEKNCEIFGSRINNRRRNYNFYSIKMRQFSRCVMQKPTRRLILPRNRLLA